MFSDTVRKCIYLIFKDLVSIFFDIVLSVMHKKENIVSVVHLMMVMALCQFSIALFLVTVGSVLNWKMSLKPMHLHIIFARPYAL